MNQIDLKDKKILYQLSEDSRQSNKEIAKKVRLSEQVTGYRIKRLFEAGIINNCYIRTNPAKLGYLHYKIFLKMKNMDEHIEEEFVKYLKERKNILWVVLTRGEFDIIISVLAKDIHEFSVIYKDITLRYGSYILHRNVSMVEEGNTFSRDYLVGEDSKEFRYGGREEVVKLDSDDMKLLQLITLDARLSATEIAKKLKVSVDKVIYRMKKLKECGFLTGFGLSLNLKKMEMKQYLLALKMQNMSKSKYTKLKEICKKNKSLQYFIYVVGDHDLDLELEIQNEEQLNDLFKELKKEFTYELMDYKMLEIVKEEKLNYFPF